MLIILSTSLLAQNKKVQTFKAPGMPIDQTTSKISYSNVVETSGDAKTVKENALKWFHSYYKNSSNIIKKNEETILVGNPRFRILSPKSKKGVQTTAGIVEYFIKIYFKDGKYKYDITDFNWKQTSRFPIEKWLNKDSPTYKQSYAFYLQQVDEYVKTTIASLEKAMNTKPVVKKEDW
jgi:hypothetical protein